uniref:Uncharacterized protein n=1 Tax=Panagrolaimus sp. JU765 TaxID=591449 RepID=A0AC34Q8P6_9BILA
MFTKIFVFITFFGLIFAVEISSTSSTTANNSNVAVGDPGLKAFASFFENIGKLMSATAKDAEKVANDNSTTVEASDGTITADVDPKLKIVSSVFESFGKLMANAANETGGGGNETKIVGKINPFENLMEFFNNMAKLDKELKKMNLTMDDLKNVTWKNYTSGPLYELSKKEVFQNVFGD